MPTHNHHHHRRNDSGELDVFEAARYYNDNFALTQKVAKEERQGYLRGGRVSLDMPTLRNHHILHQFNHPSSQPYPQKHQEKQHEKQQQQQQQSKEMKKHKQPSSPGGKLAHFLNSLFNQTSSSKKKKSSSKSSSLSLKDEDESSSGRRKRRSSISHFRSTSSAIDAQSIYSISSSSGFRTPPPYNLNNTQTPKSCKDFHNFSHQKQAFDHNAFSSSNPRNVHLIGRGSNDNKQEQKGSSLDWFDEKFKLINGSKDFKHTHQEKKKVEEIFKNFKKQEEEEGDDGCESDSSSDLFELQIDYKFGFCSSGLPVYETTHMDTIKRSSTTPITNGPIKN